MALSVRIPSAQDIGTVAPASSISLREETANADDFGAQSGHALANMGATLNEIGTRLAAERQAATDAVAESSYKLNYQPAAQKAVYDAQQRFPNGGPEQTKAVSDALGTVHQNTIQTLAQQGITPSQRLAPRLEAHNLDFQTHYMVEAVTAQHNDQIKGLQLQLDKNAATIGAQVLSGAMPVDQGIKAADDVANSGRGLFHPADLQKLRDHWRDSIIDAAAEGAARAGDKTRADAIRQKYYGTVPKPSVGLDDYTRRTFQIESGGNPNAVTGSNRGLGQFGPEEEKRFGITDANRNDPAAQSAALAREADVNRPILAKVLGRDPTNAELYIAHQQGQAGGPALLANPDQPAWQVIRPFYKSDAMARLAISGNIPGDTALKGRDVDTITAGEFTDMWAGKFDRGAGGGKTSAAPGDVAGKQYAQAGTGIATDASAGPLPDEAAPAYPNAEKALKLDNKIRSTVHAAQVDAHQALTLRDQAIKRASDEAELKIFQDMHSGAPTIPAQQILNDMTIPLTKPAREKLYNLKVAATGGNHDEKTYGPGFVDLYQRIHAADGDPNRITDPTQLYPMVRSGGPLTLAGADKLIAEINGRKTPEGEAEAALKKQFFANAKSQISGSDEGLHIKDPKGDDLFLRFLAQAFPAYEAGRKEGKSAAQLLNPESPDYVGKAITGFKRPMDQWFSDVVHDAKPAAGAAFDPKTVSKLDDLVAAYRAGKVTKAVADQTAIDKGWAVRPAPPVVMPQIPMSR